MDKDLIEVYAHGNMNEALLGLLIEELIRRDPNPTRYLEKLRADFKTRLLDTEKPVDLDQNEFDLVQSRALTVVDKFFHRAAVQLGYKADTDDRA